MGVRAAILFLPVIHGLVDHGGIVAEQGDLVVPDFGFGGRRRDLRKLPLVLLGLLLLQRVDLVHQNVRVKDAFLLDGGAKPGDVPQLHQHEPGEGVLVQGDLLVIEIGRIHARLRQREAAHALAALDVVLPDHVSVGVEADHGAGAGEEVGELGRDPAAGAPDAGDHGAGADLQGFAARERRRHVEEELTGGQLYLQLAPGLLNADGGILIQLDGLGIVQADIGIAGLPGGDGIAAVQAHVLDNGLRHAGGILDGHGAAGLYQPHGGCLGLACGGRRYGQPHR